jgi:hypothetical protein
MQMPTPTDDHRKLHRLAGTWIGEERLEPSPWGPGGAAVGRITARVALDGLFVVSDYVEEKDGKISFGGHSVFGWDPAARNVTWYWFDTMGANPPEPRGAPGTARRSRSGSQPRRPRAATPTASTATTGTTSRSRTPSTVGRPS